MFSKKVISILLLATSLQSNFAFATEGCATNQAELVGNLSAFRNTEEWVENTAGDNRPLRVSVTVDAERIFLTFDKSDAVVDEAQTNFLQRASNADYTLWGEGPVEICPNNNNTYKIVFLGGTRVTSDAHSAMRSNFTPGAQLNLRLNRESNNASGDSSSTRSNNAVANIRISAGLWGATFLPNN